MQPKNIKVQIMNWHLNYYGPNRLNRCLSNIASKQMKYTNSPALLSF
jgi:hypothetical protein